MFKSLKECNSIVVKLNISNNSLDDACMKSLGELIQNTQNFDTLNLSRNQITSKGIDTLLEYLIGNTVLENLTLFGNHLITDTSIPLLVKVIEQSRIGYLMLQDTSITRKNPLILPLADNVMKYEFKELNLLSL